jgi:hypothetical protein
VAFCGVLWRKPISFYGKVEQFKVFSPHGIGSRKFMKFSEPWRTSERLGSDRGQSRSDLGLSSGPHV